MCPNEFAIVDTTSASAIHLFIHLLRFNEEPIPVCISQKVGEHLGQVVSQWKHIWHLICDLITNKICGLRFCVYLTWTAPPSDSAVIFLELTANGPLTAMPCSALKFSMSFLHGRWSVCYVRSIWTVDRNICMNYLTSRPAWKTVFFSKTQSAAL